MKRIMIISLGGANDRVEWCKWGVGALGGARTYTMGILSLGQAGSAFRIRLHIPSVSPTMRRPVFLPIPTHSIVATLNYQADSLRLISRGCRHSPLQRQPNRRLCLLVQGGGRRSAEEKELEQLKPRFQARYFPTWRLGEPKQETTSSPGEILHTKQRRGGSHCSRYVSLLRQSRSTILYL